MKKIKLLLSLLIAFTFLTANVYAEEPNDKTSLVEVGGKVLFEKGAAKESEITGASFDSATKTLTLNKDIDTSNGVGVKIIDMGDDFTLVIDGDVNYSVTERNDGIFITNTKVTVKRINDGYLNIAIEEGSGIIVDGDAELHLTDIHMSVDTIRYTNAVVDIWDNALVVATKIYQNGEEKEISTITINHPVTEEELKAAEEVKNNTTLKRRDSLKDIAVYAVIAGLLVVGGIVVLIVTIKNQKK